MRAIAGGLLLAAWIAFPTAAQSQSVFCDNFALAALHPQPVQGSSLSVRVYGSWPTTNVPDLVGASVTGNTIRVQLEGPTLSQS